MRSLFAGPSKWWIRQQLQGIPRSSSKEGEACQQRRLEESGVRPWERPLLFLTLRSLKSSAGQLYAFCLLLLQLGEVMVVFISARTFAAFNF